MTDTFFLNISIAILLAVLVALYRVLVGPTIIDRIVGVNVIGTKTIAVIVLTGYLFERVEFFIDIAFLYALINFVGAVAVLKFVRYGNFAQAEIELETPRDPHEAPA